MKRGTQASTSLVCWRRGWQGSTVVALALLLVMAVVPGEVTGDESTRKEDARPERGMAIWTEYSGVIISKGETVRLDLTVENKGRRDENVHLTVTSVPKGWKALIRAGGFTVTGVPVPGGKSRTLTFVAEPEGKVEPGHYRFRVEGRTADGALTSRQMVQIRVEDRPGAGAEDLRVTTSYPVLRGPSDSRFEFTLDVTNKSDSDRTVALSARTPERWEATFKPAFESKQISSLRLRAGQSQSVSVEVTPPRDARPGDYPVLVRVSSGQTATEAKLTVALTGTYKLDAGTPTGVLSLDARPGRPATLSMYVRNTGSALNQNITLSAFKPEDWKVKFTPERIDGLEPGELKQVEVEITPAARALVGDYSVPLTASGQNASKSVELRVTVKASTAWAWIGVGLILAVIGGLGGLFAWLGRR